MADAKLIRIVIDISDITKKIDKVQQKAKKAEGFIEKLSARFTTFTRTAFRIAGSIVRLTGKVADVTLFTAILAGAQTQLTIRRLMLRAVAEAALGNVAFAAMLVIQAGLLETEFIANLANQEQMRQHIDRINAMADMNQ